MKEAQLTPAELREFRAFKAEKEKQENAQKEQSAYKAMVSETVEVQFTLLEDLSESIRKRKASVYDAFNSALEMKAELFKVKEDQMSHTFINKDGTKRIILGYYSIDEYDDTINEGIAIVKEAIAELGKDENSIALVSAVMNLLSRDKKGNLQASRVMKLRKLAEESSNAKLLEGVQIIEKAHRPARSKTFVRAERKTEQGGWIPVALSITEN